MASLRANPQRFSIPNANMITVTLLNVFSVTARGAVWLVLGDKSGQNRVPIFVDSSDLDQ